ncbi:hypothetical protein VTH06DRAFT_817 [Thermothelomyces fergusii]
MLGWGQGRRRRWKPPHDPGPAGFRDLKYPDNIRRTTFQRGRKFTPLGAIFATQSFAGGR